MATIVNVASYEKAREAMKGMPANVLAAQQISLRAVIEALTFLLNKGCDKTTADAILRDTKETLCICHEVANARGVQLFGYR